MSNHEWLKENGSWIGVIVSSIIAFITMVGMAVAIWQSVAMQKQNKITNERFDDERKKRETQEKKLSKLKSKEQFLNALFRSSAKINNVIYEVIDPIKGPGEKLAKRATELRGLKSFLELELLSCKAVKKVQWSKDGKIKIQKIIIDGVGVKETKRLCEMISDIIDSLDEHINEMLNDFKFIPKASTVENFINFSSSAAKCIRNENN